MHPSSPYPVIHACGHTHPYESGYTGDKLLQILLQVAQQSCPPCNRAMHYQAPAGANDAELYRHYWMQHGQQPTGHAAHRKIRNTADLLRKCRQCGEDRLRRTIAKYPPESIKGAHARRQAEIFGVK